MIVVVIVNMVGEREHLDFKETLKFVKYTIKI